MATVECRGIRKVYGSLEVMRDFDLKIDNHEFVVFLGPSGWEIHHAANDCRA